MAESLLPRLRVAEWLDRADAAKADLDELDLRDLRSVVASGDDPMVARDETTRALSNELKLGLAEKQEKELKLWFADIDSAIGVGRVIRALKLSSQPPKAGVRFPVELAHKLAEAATHSFNTDTISDRWSALLEATAFSPIRSQVVPTTRPDPASDDLLATVKRVAPLLPHIAALFGIVNAEGVAAPKPLRPTRPAPPAKKPAPTPRSPTSVASAAVPVTEPAPTEAVVPEDVEVEAAVVVPEAVEVEAAAVVPEAVVPEAVEVEAEAVVPEAVEVEAEAVVPDAEAIDAPADTEAVEPASATD